MKGSSREESSRRGKGSVSRRGEGVDGRKLADEELSRSSERGRGTEGPSPSGSALAL